MASLIGEGSGRLRLGMTENCTDGRATCSSAAPGPAATCRCRVRFTEPGTARRHVAFRTDDTPALRRRGRARGPAFARRASRVSARAASITNHTLSTESYNRFRHAGTDHMRPHPDRLAGAVRALVPLQAPRPAPPPTGADRLDARVAW